MSQTADLYDKFKKQLAKLQNSSYSYDRQEDLDSTISKLVNRGDFSYNPSSDSMYNALRESYAKLGSDAYSDTLARGNAQSGGYTNTAALTSAGQARGKYVAQLASQLPTLYNLALQTYKANGEKLGDIISVLQEDKSGKYKEYTDALSGAQTALKALQSAYETSLKQDTDKYKAELSKQSSDSNLAYKYAALNNKSSSDGDSDGDIDVDDLVKIQKQISDDLSEAKSTGNYKTVYTKIQGLMKGAYSDDTINNLLGVYIPKKHLQILQNGMS